MRKTLRMFFMLTLALIGYSSAFADVTDELTLSTFGVSGTSYTDVTGKTASSNAVYAAQMAGGNSSIQLRSKNSNSGIVTTASGGKLKSVTVTFNAATTDRKINIYGKNTAYSVPSDLYGDEKGELLGSIAANDENKTLTINGDYTFIGLRSNDGAIYVEKITIVWDGEGGGSTVTVKTPEIIGTTPFTESTQVSISGPDGGSTYYTTDGSTPSKTNGTVYTAPFTITETTTVKAIGYDEDDNASSVAEKTFTKESEISVSTLKEFIDLADNTKVALNLTNAQVLGAGNSNIVIKDATGSILIYDKNLKLEKGQTVNGTLKGLKVTYGGLPEIKDISESSLSTEAGTLTNKTVTPEQMIADDYITFSYKLENVECAKPEGNSNYYFTAGEKSIQIRDQFKIGNVTADGKYNLVGLLGVYNNNVQFWPTEVPEAAQAITYPEAANIAAVKEFEEGTTVKLTLKDAVVNYVNGTRDIFAEDATGAIDLFQLGIEAKAGDVLNGTIIVKYSPYNNLPEVVAVTGVTVTDEITVTEGTAPTPKEMSIADAAKIENACKLVTIKNITLVADKVEDKTNYYADADKTLQVFDKYKVGYTPNTESAMDYTGILVPFKEQFQICPTVEPTASQGGDTPTPATSKTWNFSEWEAGDITETKTVDGLTVVATSDKKVTIDSNNKTFEDVKYTQRLKLGGTGSGPDTEAPSRYLSFQVTGDCNIKVFFAHASSSGDDRTLNLATGEYSSIAATQSLAAGETATLSYDYKGGETTVYLYSANSGLNLYAIIVTSSSSSVNSIEVVKPENNIRYNLAGQRVDESYKGVVIMNGKKFVVK